MYSASGMSWQATNVNTKSPKFWMNWSTFKSFRFRVNSSNREMSIVYHNLDIFTCIILLKASDFNSISRKLFIHNPFCFYPSSICLSQNRWGTVFWYGVSKLLILSFISFRWVSKHAHGFISFSVMNEPPGALRNSSKQITYQANESNTRILYFC